MSNDTFLIDADIEQESLETQLAIPAEYLCSICVSGETVKRRRLNTCYQEDEKNYLTSCWSCFVELWENYDGLWVSASTPSPFSTEPPEDLK